MFYIDSTVIVINNLESLLKQFCTVFAIKINEVTDFLPTCLFAPKDKNMKRLYLNVLFLAWFGTVSLVHYNPSQDTPPPPSHPLTFERLIQSNPSDREVGIKWHICL